MIKVVNKRTHTPSNDDVHIGRPSVLGNPFPMSNESERLEVVEKYREWLRTQYRSSNPAKFELLRLAKLSKTQDINLVCYCAPKACHGDVVKYAIECIAKSLDL